jgi:hypothetical protein
MFKPVMVACAAVLVISCLASCVGPATAPRAGVDVPKEKLLEVTRDFLKVRHPDWLKETYDLPCTINDLGNLWEVRFDLPVDMVGGGPAVYIAKGDMTVWAAFHEQ